MIATPTAELLRRLREGVLDQGDVEMLEQVSARNLVEELKSSYPVTFQERRIGRKWELSLARTFRAELAFHPLPEAVFVSVRLVPAYLNCLMLNIEDDSLTGITRLSRLTVWPVKRPARGLALKSGRGFKLDKTPDGWALKPMRKRTVRLSEQFLRERGWRFDHLQRLIPTP